MWGGIRVGEYFHFILDSCYLLFTLTHVCTYVLRMCLHWNSLYLLWINIIFVMCYLLLLQPNYNNYESRLFSPIFAVFQTNNNNSITHTHTRTVSWVDVLASKENARHWALHRRDARAKSRLSSWPTMCVRLRLRWRIDFYGSFFEKLEFLCCAIFVFRLTLLSISNCTS